MAATTTAEHVIVQCPAVPSCGQLGYWKSGSFHLVKDDQPHTCPQIPGR